VSTRKYHNKYHNKKVVIEGISFASKHEANRYLELSMLQKTGEITELKTQVPFELIPSQRDPETKKVVERACNYVADFTYYQDGEFVVEDTKGFRTPDYIIKRKLMLRVYGIRIREI
jgi:hypothetical protein